MLTISGKTDRSLCDGIQRRRFLQVGALSAFGLSLPGLLRAEQSGQSFASSKKSVILIWMHGGPSQLDTFDMKPLAPAEYRGPWKPIASDLPGLDVCELLPEHAKVMKHCTIIRSFSHNNGDHWAAAHWMLTGRLGATGADRKPRQPSMGAVASHLLGPTRPGSLASVNMNDGGLDITAERGSESITIPSGMANSVTATKPVVCRQVITRASRWSTVSANNG